MSNIIASFSFAYLIAESPQLKADKDMIKKEKGRNSQYMSICCSAYSWGCGRKCRVNFWVHSQLVDTIPSVKAVRGCMIAFVWRCASWMAFSARAAGELGNSHDLQLMPSAHLYVSGGDIQPDDF
jgi:hypothetical protein